VKVVKKKPFLYKALMVLLLIRCLLFAQAQQGQVFWL
jgi:hypothetical protein